MSVSIDHWSMLSAAYNGGAEHAQLLSFLSAETVRLRAAAQGVLDDLAAARAATASTDIDALAAVREKIDTMRQTITELAQ
jgi:hypothetical protein